MNSYNRNKNKELNHPYINPNNENSTTKKIFISSYR